MGFHVIRELPEQNIARLVAVPVVELLEIVQVQHDDCEGTLRARHPVQLFIQDLPHVAPVEEFCQRILDRLTVKDVAQMKIREAQGHAFRRCCRKLLLVFQNALFSYLGSTDPVRRKLKVQQAEQLVLRRDRDAHIARFEFLAHMGTKALGQPGLLWSTDGPASRPSSLSR